MAGEVVVRHMTVRRYPGGGWMIVDDTREAFPHTVYGGQGTGWCAEPVLRQPFLTRELAERAMAAEQERRAS